MGVLNTSEELEISKVVPDLGFQKLVQIEESPGII